MGGIEQASQNWASVTMTFAPNSGNAMGFAKWVNDQGNRYAYICTLTDSAPATGTDTTSIGYKIQQAGYANVILNYALVNQVGVTSAFVGGIPASFDFGRRNGRTTLAYRSQPGLSVSVTDDTTASNLKLAGYNFYGSYGGGNSTFVNYQTGSITGPFKWADTFFNQVWLNNELQRSLIGLLMSVGSVPYTPDGYSLIRGACASPIKAAVNFGAIRAGVTLSDDQIAELTAAAGQDISTPIQNAGYYLQILDPTADVRAARGTPQMTLWYTDGESVQNINMASIVIQ